MIKSVLRARVLNPYRSHKPRGFYGVLTGHRGVDLDYKFADLPCPVTGQVVAIKEQTEMGHCMYVQDLFGNIHIFGHLQEYKKQIGDKVLRNDIIAVTGNTGTKTTAPHLHWEIITNRPFNFVDRIMKRKLYQFSGWNTSPILYLKDLYFKYQVDLDGNPITNI